MNSPFASSLTREFGEPFVAELAARLADTDALRRSLVPHQTRSRILRCLLAEKLDRAPASETSAPAGPAPIPHRILQFWHEAAPPQEVAELVAGWRDRHPGYAHALFSDDSARDFIATHFPGDPLRAFDYCRHPVLRGDVFRYLWLLREGGIYVNADEECLRPIDDALSDAAIRLAPRAWLLQDGREIPVRRAIDSKLDASVCGFYLSSAPIAAAPAHPIVQAATDRAVEAILQARSRGTPARVADATAPTIFTETVLIAVLRTRLASGDAGDLRLFLDWAGHYAAPRRLSYRGGATSWRSEHTHPELPRTPTPSPGQSGPAIVAKLGEPPAPAAQPSSMPAANPLAVTQALIEYRAFVERFIALNATRSIVEIGCGEWPFVRLANLPSIQYTGFDIAEAIVQRNRTAFAPRRNVGFEIMPDDYAKLPQADLLLMKDVLPHLPNAAIMRMKTDLLPRFGQALVTSTWKRLNTGVNIDAEAGRFRALDLKRDPYRFPGAYVFENWGEWERIRTLLVCHDPT